MKKRETNIGSKQKLNLSNYKLPFWKTSWQLSLVKAPFDLYRIIKIYYLWIGLLPALVQPESFLAQIFPLRIQATFSHVHRNIMHRVGQRVVQLLQMYVPVIVHNLGLMEQTVHVAFQLFILVNLAVAELNDGLCQRARKIEMTTDQSTVMLKYFEHFLTVRNSGLFSTNVMQWFQSFQQLWGWVLEKCMKKDSILVSP